ncbi:MAG: hypothetical protein GF346_02555 [Candidatus Eisenbacteria bacterium]|nr:hypothetical protein [Candidatus Latescibacterota bacterium]MBD3301301.1 hypothetical protein [Candidatus Eisenbacteria bacterium]
MERTDPMTTKRISAALLLAWALLLHPAAPLDAADDDRAQPRAHGVPVPVPVEKVSVDDGDTVEIAWEEENETVRILGIDTPEIRHPEHDIPFDQPFGPEATAFAKGVLSMAEEITLLRASMRDPYGRTLGYLFVNDRNYSVLVLEAGLAVETVSYYGDNGLPEPAADCLAAAEAAGPVPFEPPHLFRKRMREVSGWMESTGSGSTGN